MLYLGKPLLKYFMLPFKCFQLFFSNFETSFCCLWLHYNSMVNNIINNNPLNGLSSRTTQVSRHQKKTLTHSLTHLLYLWALYNIFN